VSVSRIEARWTCESGGVAYYCVQGPTLVIEYAPRDGLAGHVHEIIRDPTNDYGKNLPQP
jgi:hypothetical protein